MFGATGSQRPALRKAALIHARLPNMANEPEQPAANGNKALNAVLRHRLVGVACISAVMVLVIVGLVDGVARARSDSEIPVLNVGPICRETAQQTASVQSKAVAPNQAVTQCFKDEQAMREQLIAEWSTFAADEKKNCVGVERIVPLPSYTELVACLELSKNAKAMANNPAVSQPGLPPLPAPAGVRKP